ncbi:MULTISPECIES: hypothetical protein [Clostridium]|uniref:hypothetical protein n=1 Tax=Clostridium TaxID=1485 RepID=UPI0003107F86|nr:MULTISPECIES: hypothetical protein [Clostridium]
MGNVDFLIELKYKADGKGLEGMSFIENKMKEASKYFLCGGILNKNGGKLIFKARNIEEVNEFAKSNPMAKLVICN